MLIWENVRFLNLILEGALGGSENTTDGPDVVNAVPGDWATPLIRINNWSSVAVTDSPSTFNANCVLTPLKSLSILSSFLTIEVKISSELVSLLCLNNTSVLLNSVYIGCELAKDVIWLILVALKILTSLTRSDTTFLPDISLPAASDNSPNILNPTGWLVSRILFLHSLIGVCDLIT